MEKLNKVTTNGVTYTLQDYELNNSLSGIYGLVKSYEGYLSEAVAGTDYDYPVLVGTSAPTPTTQGSIGQRYINKNATIENGLIAEYVCTSVGSTYTWIAVGATGNLLSVIADIYNTSSTYAIGDVVTHEGGLYKCTATIAVAEIWTPTHWSSITVDELIVEKGELINEKAPRVHNHTVSDIINTIPVEKGGTGATNVAAARASLGAASTITYNKKIELSGWSEDVNSGGYYSNTVVITGVLETDNPIVDVVLASNKQDNESYLRAWGLIERITTGTNQIVLYAKEVPSTAFTM